MECNNAAIAGRGVHNGRYVVLTSSIGCCRPRASTPIPTARSMLFGRWNRLDDADLASAVSAG
jgi:hypothetical protein